MDERAKGNYLLNLGLAYYTKINFRQCTNMMEDELVEYMNFHVE